MVETLPKCFKCKKPALGMTVTVDGKLLHADCFTCHRCNVVIEGGYKVVEGKDYCPDCYEEISPKETCAACKKMIKGQYVKTGQKSYHKACFICHICRKEIQGKYTESKTGAMTCEDCQPRCAGCDKRLSGPTLTV